MIGNKTDSIAYINSLKDDAIVKVQEIKETRSQAQNRLYHMWLRDLVGEFEKKGYIVPKDHLHDGLKERLIESTIEKNLFTGELKTVRKSTTKLNKKEFSKYITDIERYLWQGFEISYPLPTDIERDLI